MTMKKAYHVVVIGDGITGLSTAFHLKKKGIKRIAISQLDLAIPSSRLGSGFCAGGQLDNFTRLSHTQGRVTAGDLWRFGDSAFDHLVEFAKTYGISHKVGRRLRLLASSSEVHEAELAVEQLKAENLFGALNTDSLPTLGARILGVQNDGHRGGFVDPLHLAEILNSRTASIPRIPSVSALKPEKSSIALEIARHQTIHTEIVVVANHLGTGSLIPELAPHLIPYADQWSEFTLPRHEQPDVWQPGLAFTCNHTHEWGVFADENTLHLGGARYMRPLAGIEAKHASVEPRITEHLKKLILSTFGISPDSKIQTKSTFAFRDIRPTDELPIIGPMYGEPRILTATGFSGQGYQAPFYAGLCIADLVAEGDAKGLPRVLWPERLRSLGDQDL